MGHTSRLPRQGSWCDLVMKIRENILSWTLIPRSLKGWSGGAMVLGKLPVPGRPTIWISIGQGPTALAVGAGGSCFDIFTLIYPFSPLFPSLWETARYRLKYCLKGPFNQKQPTNQPRSFRGNAIEHLNIKEWTRMDFASSTREENRIRWKGFVANSSVVPRRPSKVMG